MRAVDAQKIINLRENAGLTQVQLAEHIGMSPSGIAMIETEIAPTILSNFPFLFIAA